MPTSRSQQILDRSAELFAQRGYLAVSVDEIGEAVGISGPALYRHFASKHDILARLVSIAADRVEAELEEVADGGGDAERSLRALIATLSRLVAREATVIGLYQREYRHLPEAERARVVRLHRSLASRLEALVRAVRPELQPEQSRLLVRMVDGIFSAMREPDALEGPAAEALAQAILSALLIGRTT